MANITVRKDNGNLAPAQPTREADPFRTMRDLLRWDPFRQMTPSFELDAGDAFAPAFEVKETKDSYLFTADVPGVKDNDLEVTLTGNRLTIGGHRASEKEEKGDTYYSCERKYGAFSRAYTLPDGIDAEHLRAELKAGVLTIAVPKKPESQPKKIAVNAGGTKA